MMQSGKTESLDLLAQQLSAIRDPEGLQRYEQDFSGWKSARPDMVFRPQTTDEVAAILRVCSAEQRQVTVQGGLTGLAGGASPDIGDVAISMERMNQVLEFDEIGGTITVQPGMVLEKLCEHVEAAGWYFPLDFGARGSCQVGGNVSTNAGGNRVLRYGTTRMLVLGMEVVLADGRVLSMLNKGLKNNTGLDLKHLFIGAEGTLGVVTKLVLRLFPKPQARYSALVAAPSFSAVTQLLKAARAAFANLSSFELMWHEYLSMACKTIGRSEPFDQAYPLYVLLETEGDLDVRAEEALQEWLEAQLEKELISDVILPQSSEQAAQLWHMRDASGEILKELTPYVAFDVGLPMQHSDAFVQRVTQRLEQTYPQAHNLFFGHLGDGNLHLTTGPFAEEDLLAVEELVYEEVAAVGGSISAEHGIGRIKKPFLHFSRNEEELALMRQLKELLDPQNILNAGRVYPN